MTMLVDDTRTWKAPVEATVVGGDERAHIKRADVPAATRSTYVDHWKDVDGYVRETADVEFGDRITVQMKVGIDPEQADSPDYYKADEPVDVEVLVTAGSARRVVTTSFVPGGGVQISVSIRALPAWPVHDDDGLPLTDKRVVYEAEVHSAEVEDQPPDPIERELQQLRE